jgi:hypothetical protein
MKTKTGWNQHRDPQRVVKEPLGPTHLHVVAGVAATPIGGDVVAQGVVDVAVEAGREEAAATIHAAQGQDAHHLMVQTKRLRGCAMCT